MAFTSLTNAEAKIVAFSWLREISGGQLMKPRKDSVQYLQDVQFLLLYSPRLVSTSCLPNSSQFSQA